MPDDVTRALVLIVEHEAQTPAGWLGDWLLEAGAELDVRRPHAGEPLPPDLTGHAAVVVLGGSMDAWDDGNHPWLAETRMLLRDAAEQGVPALGVCLGHQLATLALGGTVARNPAGPSLAVLPVGWEPGASADPLLGPVAGAPWGLHWNRDVVTDLPPGATVLARSPDGAVQVARLAPSVWGVQLHPEVSPAILRAWVRDEGEPYTSAGLDLAGFVEECEARETELAAGWRPLAAALLELVEERRP